MVSTGDLILGVLLPAVVAWAIAWALRRRHRAAWAIGLAAGFITGQISLQGKSVWAMSESTHALTWLALAAAIAATLDARPWARWPLRVIISCAVPALTLRKLIGDWTSPSSLALVLGLGAGVCLLWSLLAVRRTGSPDRAGLGVALIGVILLAALQVPNHSMLMGQLTGVLAAALAGMMISRPGLDAHAAAGVLAVLVGPLLMIAVIHDLPIHAAVAVALAIAPASSAFAPTERHRPWQMGWLARLGVCFVIFAVVLTPRIIQIRQEMSETDTHEAYGY